MLHKKQKTNTKNKKNKQKNKTKKTNNCRCTSYLDRAHSGWLQYHRLVQMNHAREVGSFHFDRVTANLRSGGGGTTGTTTSAAAIQLV